MLKNILRIVISFIFIVSGFVKAIDVKGFSFKLEEYFSPQVFNIPFLEKYSIIIAIFVVLLEFILGLLILLNIKTKKFIFSLILLCIFFGFLTFYSAYYQVVTECGCFGDAIKLTPWQSFSKDIILLVFLIFLYFMNWPETKISNAKKGLFSFILLGIFYIIYMGILHEPLIDFRDYKIGKNILTERKKIEQNPAKYKTFYVLENKKNKNTIKVSENDYINKNYWQDSNWRILNDKTTTEIEKEGYSSEISKFSIEDSEGKDLTDEILNEPHVLLICSYSPRDLDSKFMAQLENKVNEQKKYSIYGISPVPNTFKTLKNTQMDGTAIKTIARSNPFVLELKHGTIVNKMSAKDWLKTKY